MLVAQLSALLLLALLVDASITVWRRGDRQKALLVGGSMVFFVLSGLSQSLLVFWGILQMPITGSLFFMGIIAAMGFELSRDVLRAVQLARDLHESEERMTLAAEATNLGVWFRDLGWNENLGQR
jgi:two-component system, LuxR family, sensor kinase FixL